MKGGDFIMPVSVEEQMVAQIKKLQKRIDDLEGQSGASDIAKNQQSISDLKTDLEDFKKTRLLKLDFGEW